MKYNNSVYVLVLWVIIVCRIQVGIANQVLIFYFDIIIKLLFTSDTVALHKLDCMPFGVYGVVILIFSDFAFNTHVLNNIIIPSI